MYIEKRETGKCISLKKVLYLQYEIYSLLPLNKIVQRNSQHYTTIHNTRKFTKYCTQKIIKKFNFVYVLVLLNTGKIKFTFSIEYSSY